MCQLRILPGTLGTDKGDFQVIKNQEEQERIQRRFLKERIPPSQRGVTDKNFTDSGHWALQM